jgi:hypothetical protein
LPSLAIVAPGEIPANVKIHSLGVVTLDDEAPRPALDSLAVPAASRPAVPPRAAGEPGRVEEVRA